MPWRLHSCCNCNHIASIHGHDHALLRLAEPHLPRSQTGVLQRRACQVDVGTDTLGHFPDCRRQPARPAVGDRREQAGGVAQHIDQQLLDDGVADLHAGTGDIARGRVHRRARERGPTQAVAPGAATEHDHEVAGVWAGQRGSVIGDADAAAVHQWVGDVTGVVQHRAGNRGQADLVAVVGDAGHDARFDQSRMQNAIGDLVGRRSVGPKHKMSVTAIGRWAAPITSRITPPTPVFAPPNGSMAEG